MHQIGFPAFPRRKHPPGNSNRPPPKAPLHQTGSRNSAHQLHPPLRPPPRRQIGFLAFPRRRHPPGNSNRPPPKAPQPQTGSRNSAHRLHPLLHLPPRRQIGFLACPRRRHPPGNSNRPPPKAPQPQTGSRNSAHRLHPPLRLPQKHPPQKAQIGSRGLARLSLLPRQKECQIGWPVCKEHPQRSRRLVVKQPCRLAFRLLEKRRPVR